MLCSDNSQANVPVCKIYLFYVISKMEKSGHRPEVPVNLSLWVFTVIATSRWLGKTSREWNPGKLVLNQIFQKNLHTWQKWPIKNLYFAGHFHVTSIFFESFSSRNAKTQNMILLVQGNNFHNFLAISWALELSLEVTDFDSKEK